MCGIGGIRRFGPKPIEIDTLNMLFLGLQHRGMDASGIAIANPEGIFIYKEDEPGWKFIDKQGYKNFVKKYLHEETFSALVHTRAATDSGIGTRGNPQFNKNNHPLFAGDTAVTHNGTILNHQHLFSELHIERNADTDSDVLRAILDKEGFTRKAIRQLSRCAGSAELAAVSLNFPGCLLLARSGSPLVIAADSDHMFWASTKGAIHAAAKSWEEKFGLYMHKGRVDLHWRTMPANTAYLFGPEGFMWHDVLNITTHYKAPNYTKQLTEFTARREKFIRQAQKFTEPIKEIEILPATVQTDLVINEKDITFVQCKGCEKWSYVNKSYLDIIIENVFCGFCGHVCREGNS